MKRAPPKKNSRRLSNKSFEADSTRGIPVDHEKIINTKNVSIRNLISGRDSLIFLGTNLFPNSINPQTAIKIRIAPKRASIKGYLSLGR